jgi:pimeloyl-[acyl-carrier protein] methyl ester esterase
VQTDLRPAEAISGAACEAIPTEAYEVIAYHGWAFDRHCWQPWQAKFAEQGIPLKAFDRGYFGAPTQPSFEQAQSKKIILAHSYGLHLCPAQQLRLADLLIVFGGFDRFHPQEHKAQRRSQRILQHMISQFGLAPETVLQAFWQNCGLPPGQWLDPSAKVLQPLAHDLLDLDHSLLCIEFLARRPKILVIHGRDDAIAPLSQGQDLAKALSHKALSNKALSNNAQFIELIDLPGPHALPFVQLEECWQVLGPHLKGWS